MPQLPDTLQQDEMRVARNRKIDKICERFITPVRGNRA
jgi:hypothetical protein